MLSLINGLNDLDQLCGRKVPMVITKAMETQVITAVMLAFLVGGILVTLRALNAAAAWP